LGRIPEEACDVDRKVPPASPPYSPQGTAWSPLEAWKLLDIWSHHAWRGEINSKKVQGVLQLHPATQNFRSFDCLAEQYDKQNCLYVSEHSKVEFCLS